MIQIGARNMQNFILLSEVGRADKPVLLKRGPAASIEELLMAAEYVVKEGNPSDRSCASAGSRRSSATTRYTLDISAIPVLKHETHLPVIVDPSHAAGRRDLVLAARACRGGGRARTGSSSSRTRDPRRRSATARSRFPSPSFRTSPDEMRTLAQLMGSTIG